MPIRTEITPEGTAIITANEELLFDDVQNVLNAVDEHPEWASMSRLWDLRSASIYLSFKQIRRIVDEVERRRDQLHFGSAAIVVSSQADFDMASLITLVQKNPQRRVFRGSCLKRARDWLAGVDSSCTC